MLRHMDNHMLRKEPLSYVCVTRLPENQVVILCFYVKYATIFQNKQKHQYFREWIRHGIYISGLL